MQPNTRNGGKSTASRPERTDLSLDATLNMLANERRRAVIRRIEPGAWVDLEELTEYVAAEECGCSRAELDRDQYKAVYVCLYQTHLEKLDAAGLIQYDKDSKAVGPTEATARAGEILDTAESVTGEKVATVVTAHLVCHQCSHEELFRGRTRADAKTAAMAGEIEHAADTGCTEMSYDVVVGGASE